MLFKKTLQLKDRIIPSRFIYRKLRFFRAELNKTKNILPLLFCIRPTFEVPHPLDSENRAEKKLG